MGLDGSEYHVLMQLCGYKNDLHKSYLIYTCPANSIYWIEHDNLLAYIGMFVPRVHLQSGVKNIQSCQELRRKEQP